MFESAVAEILPKVGFVESRTGSEQSEVITLSSGFSTGERVIGSRLKATERERYFIRIIVPIRRISRTNAIFRLSAKKLKKPSNPKSN